jgi:hypothetical protein
MNQYEDITDENINLIKKFDKVKQNNTDNIYLVNYLEQRVFFLLQFKIKKIILHLLTFQTPIFITPFLISNADFNSKK